MEQQDYLKRQIDLLARMLGKVLAHLVGLKNKGDVSEGIEITNQILKDELDLDLDELSAVDTNKFVSKLTGEKGFNNDSLDKLAEILLLVADSRQRKERKILLEKCLAIYVYLQNTETTYSLDRFMKIEKLEKEMSDEAH